MRIAIIGNNFFGPILTRQLSEYDKTNKYQFFNTNEKKIDIIKFILNLFRINIVYSVSGSISGGGTLNLALKFNKKIIQHFIGSDVLSAIQDFKLKNMNQHLIFRSKYLCEVDWIQQELKEIKIDSQIVPIMAYQVKEEAKEIQKFSVLTYIAKGREEFYGINDFIKLAKIFSDIEFKIVGINNYSHLSSNIKCLGWVNMIEELQNSAIFIRNTKHDGLAFSIIEALSLGRVVFYNNNFPHVNYFKTFDELYVMMKNKKELYDNNNLEIDYKAIQFVNTEFNQKKILGNLKRIINE